MVELTDLPTELVTAVLSHLDYMSLLKLELTFKRFQSIIKTASRATNSPIAVNLHRAKNHLREEDFKDHESFYYLALHPCFKYLVGNFTVLFSRPMTLDDIGIFDRKTKKFTSLASEKFKNLRDEMALGTTFSKPIKEKDFHQLPRDVPYFVPRILDMANRTVGELVMDLVYHPESELAEGVPVRQRIYEQVIQEENGMCRFITGICLDSTVRLHTLVPLRLGSPFYDTESHITWDKFCKPLEKSWLLDNIEQHPLFGSFLVDFTLTEINGQKVVKFLDDKDFLEKL